MAGTRDGVRPAAGGPSRGRPRRRPQPPTDPAELLDTMLNRSGLGAANLLAAGRPRLGFLTVRDLLFHLPRRYDDLREMRKLGDLRFVEDGTVVRARVTRRRRPGRAVVPAAGSSGRSRELEDETGCDRGDLVRAPLHRAPAVRRRRRSSCRASSSTSAGS